MVVFLRTHSSSSTEHQAKQAVGPTGPLLAWPGVQTGVALPLSSTQWPPEGPRRAPGGSVQGGKMGRNMTFDDSFRICMHECVRACIHNRMLTSNRVQ